MIADASKELQQRHASPLQTQSLLSPSISYLPYIRSNCVLNHNFYWFNQQKSQKD